MFLKAIREEFDPSTNDKLGNFGRYLHYQLFNDELLVGEFFHKNIISYFYLNGITYHIPNEYIPFKKPLYNIIDPQNESEILSLKKSFWRHLLYNEIGMAQKGNDIYRYKRTSLKVTKAPLFDYSTGQLEIYMTSPGNSIQYKAGYRFIPNEHNSFRPLSDFSMTIKSESENLLLIYTGLFFIEKLFEK
ncbi:MAG TPA: hypothetical protein VF476_13900 [Chitinophagaceae bacterium]